MKEIYIKFENGKLVESTEPTDYRLEWDGVYYNYYGESKDYTYEGVTYDCFPIVTITEGLTIEDITLFGCEGTNRCEDSELFHLPIDFSLWADCKPFNDIYEHSNL